MIKKQDFEGKLYIEGVLFSAWEDFSIRTVTNDGVFASFSVLDKGVMRNQIISGTKIHFFIKNSGFAWVDKKEVPVGEFFLCFDGVITGVEFSSFRSQNLKISCEGYSYFSRISKFFYIYDSKKLGEVEDPEDLNEILNFEIDEHGNVVYEELIRNFLNQNRPIVAETTTGTKPVYDVLVDLVFKADAFALERLFRNKSALFFQKIMNVEILDAFKTTEEVETVTNSSGEEASEVSTTTKPVVRIFLKELKLGEMFRFFLHRFAEVKEMGGVFFERHKKFLKSGRVKENVFVAGGIVKEGRRFSIGPEAIFKDDGFMNILRQVLLTLPNIKGNLYSAFAFLLNAFNFDFLEMSFPSKKKDGDLSTIVIKPQLFVSIPPSCNVLFAEDIQSSNGSRSLGYEPNTALFHTSAAIRLATENPIPSMKEDITAEETADLRSGAEEQERIRGKNASVPRSFDQDFFVGAEIGGLTSSTLSGVSVPVHFFEDVSEIRDIFNSSYVEEGGDSGFKFSFQKAINSYWSSVYAARRFSCSLNFSPFLLCGFPCVVFEEYYATVGDIRSISHTFSMSQGCRTSIDMVRTRWVDYINRPFMDGAESNSLYNTPEFLKHDAKETFEKVFGTKPFISVTDPPDEEKSPEDEVREIKEGIDLKIKEMFNAMKKEGRSSGFFENVLNASRIRSFVSEKYFFSRLFGVEELDGTIAVGIKKGLFDSFDFKDLGENKPYEKIRQMTVLNWKKTLDFFAFL